MEVVDRLMGCGLVIPSPEIGILIVVSLTAVFHFLIQMNDATLFY